MASRISDDVLDALAHARNPGEPSPFDSDEPGPLDDLNIPALADALSGECYDAGWCRTWLVEDLIRRAEEGDERAIDTLESLRALPAVVRGAGVKS